jgi:hypothetical protein
VNHHARVAKGNQSNSNMNMKNCNHNPTDLRRAQLNLFIFDHNRKLAPSNLRRTLAM